MVAVSKQMKAMNAKTPGKTAVPLAEAVAILKSFPAR